VVEGKNKYSILFYSICSTIRNQNQNPRGWDTGANLGPVYLKESVMQWRQASYLACTWWNRWRCKAYGPASPAKNYMSHCHLPIKAVLWMWIRFRVSWASRIRIQILLLSSKKSKKNLDFYCFQKKKIIFVDILKASDAKSRIRIRNKLVGIRGSGSVLKCHGSTTLIKI
jgi:hypothetical protein